MNNYVSPNAKLIKFGDNKIITGSNCNCYYDKWNELQPPAASDCDGVTYDASELFTDANDIP